VDEGEDRVWREQFEKERKGGVRVGLFWEKRRGVFTDVDF
jgi:hypothetical protein